MKKTLALILAIVMMAALAVPAFAEPTPEVAGVTTQEANNSTGNNCKITYGVGQTYTISLPTAINFAVDTDLTAPNTQSCEISVSKLVISGSKPAKQQTLRCAHVHRRNCPADQAFPLHRQSVRRGMVPHRRDDRADQDRSSKYRLHPALCVPAQPCGGQRRYQAAESRVSPSQYRRRRL